MGEEGKHEVKSRSCRERLEGDEQCGDAERMDETVGVSAGLNVTFATQEALIRSREIVPRVKGLSAQGKRKGL